MSSHRRAKHSVGILVSHLRFYQLFSVVEVVKLVQWPLGQKLMVLCNPIKSLFKKPAKKPWDAFFHSLEAVPESLIEAWHCAVMHSWRTDSGMPFGRLTESVTSLTASCSETELRTCRARHPFCETWASHRWHVRLEQSHSHRLGAIGILSGRESQWQETRMQPVHEP